MGRGVVARERVLRHQEPDQDHVDAAAPARVVHELREDEGPRLVVIGGQSECADDQRHAQDVPPHAHAVQERDDADAEGVEETVEEEDGREEEDRAARSDLEAELQVQPGPEERRRAEVDARRHRHLAQHVEPPREPRPRRRRPRGRQAVRPEVEAGRGRVRRADLGHRQADQQGHQADRRPAPGDHRRAAGVHAEEVQGQASREDRDDREGDRVVRERRHTAGEDLGVPQLGQAFLVRQRQPTGRGVVICHVPSDSLTDCVTCATSWPERGGNATRPRPGRGRGRVVHSDAEGLPVRSAVSRCASSGACRRGGRRSRCRPGGRRGGRTDGRDRRTGSPGGRRGGRG